MTLKRYRHEGDQPYSIPDANVDVVVPGEVFESSVVIRHPAFVEIDAEGNPVVDDDEAVKSESPEPSQNTPQNIEGE